ncbi:hypothetical protein CQ13_39505 [Bradyrhizobium retamae]|uniref:Uncharacterized protein n=1 Tax=Bradyrhizobium retamae TaxID=1300035 RepID=A0A0R3NF61_9BRAD|nr:hypothetical protein CQ13_39505 [Bradyrhizobium retamae]
MLPDPTYESTLRGLQKHCVWAKLLDDTRRYFASTKLGLLEAEPHDVESIFSATPGDGRGYIGGRLIFKFRGYDGKPYRATFDAVFGRGGCFVDFFRYYADLF